MISTLRVNELMEKYPKMFSSCYFPLFNIGDFWFKLVGDLCLLVHSLGEKDDNFLILDVENKHGTLFISHQGGNSSTEMLVSFAERYSWKTCEECGEKGSLCSSNGTAFGFLRTLCHLHSVGRWKKYENGINENFPFLASLL